MNRIDHTFDSIEVGDFCEVKKTFNSNDFKAFSQLSGDSSPLHCDQQYAIKAGFDDCIVPAFLLATPFSGIAGMHIPGHRSLIIKSTMRSLRPVLYNQELNYSGKVISKNDVTQTLTINVIAFTEEIALEVVLDGEILVKVRKEPELVPDGCITASFMKKTSQGAALITGATSLIGSAIARALALAGRDLVLFYHRDRKKAMSLQKDLSQFGIDVIIRKHSVFATKNFSNLKKEDWYDDLELLIHTASSPLDSSLMELMQSNFLDLCNLTTACLPAMLRKQSGLIIGIGSSEMIRQQGELQNYAASKIAATNYLATLSNQYESFGIKATVVAPDVVDTPFSAELGHQDKVKLIPEQVAAALNTVVDGNSGSSNDIVWVKKNEIKVGSFGYREDLPNAVGATSRSGSDKLEHHDRKFIALNSEKFDGSRPTEVIDHLKILVSKVLNIDSESIKGESGVGVTGGWDSLKQIEILVEIERAYGIRFRSSQFETLTTVLSIALCVKELLES